MDRLFRASALFRAKWDEKRGEKTYGQRTLGKVLAGQTEFYDWSKDVPFTTPEELAKMMTTPKVDLASWDSDLPEEILVAIPYALTKANRPLGESLMRGEGLLRWWRSSPDHRVFEL
jgi:hypothetical protein